MSEKQRLRFGGLSRNRLRFVAPSNIALTPPTPIVDPLLIFSFSGQSNFVGSGGDPALNTGSIPGSWRITTPVVFSGLSESAATGETPLTAFADYIRTSANPGQGIVVHNWALGGQEIAAFQSGSTLFRQGVSGVIGMVSASVNTLASSSYYLSFVWDQGESDNDLGVQSETYLESISQLLTNFRSNANGILGAGNQTEIPMFITQPSYAVATASAQIAQEQFSRISSSVYLATPTYAFWHTGTAVDPHYRNTTHRRNGQLLARAASSVLISSSAWVPLRPATITANGRTVSITMEGGDGSDLVVDTTNVFPKPFYGFSYFDPDLSSGMPHIQSVALSGTRGVEITLTGPASATGRIRYAFNNITNTPFGALGRYSIGGNIRDQDATPSIYSSSLGDAMDNLPLSNWLVAFDRAIDSYVSGAGSSDDLTSGSILTNGTGIATAYDLTTFDAATSFIWAFKIRSSALPGSTRIICDRNRNPQRGISLRTFGGNLQVLCPSSLASTAESFNTTPGTLVNNQDYAVAIIYSGSGANNEERASIWINSGGPSGWSSANMVYTGTLASALSSGSISSFDFFNGNAGTTTAASLAATQIGEMAIWRNQSASVAQLQEIFPQGVSGAMGDLATSSLGLPENWWSWNGNLRDKGTRRNHVYFFNTGTSDTVVFGAPIGTASAPAVVNPNNQFSAQFVGDITSQAIGSYAMTASTSGLPVGTSPAAFSVAMWIYGSGTAPNSWQSPLGNETFLALGNQAAGAGSRLLSFSFKNRDSVPTNWEWNMYESSPDGSPATARITAPTINAWHHVVFSYDGNGATNADKLKYFIDGAQQAVALFVGTMPVGMLTSSLPIYVGGLGASSRNSCVAIDELCFYDIALTGTHATALWNNGTASVDPRLITGSSGLVHYWRMGDELDFPNIPDQIQTASVSPMTLTMQSGNPAHITGSTAPTGTVEW